MNGGGDQRGRHVLTAVRPPRLDAEAVAEILDQVIPLHRANSQKINEFYRFYRGDQPVLQRQKTVRPEIVNRIVENRAFEVVEFKKGYEFSHPLQYTNAGTVLTAPIPLLNAYARLDGKEAKDIEMAEWMYISGVGYRLCLPNMRDGPDEAPYISETLDPRSTFVVRESSVTRRVLLAGNVVCETSLSGKREYVYGVYTEEYQYLWRMDEANSEFKGKEPEIRPNTMRAIPIVEYPLNAARMGYVELCLELFNAINSLDSNRLDGIEQFVQAILWFNDCEIESEKLEELQSKNGGVIMTKSVGGSGRSPTIAYLVQQLDQSQTQVTKDDLLNAVYEICGIPSRQNRDNGGGDTGQAVVLRNGWGAAEARAKTTEKLFKRSENEYLRLVLKICRDTQAAAKEIGDLTLADIDVRFTRNRSDNMQVKSQTLETLLRSEVNPEDAYEYCEMFSDPAAVWAKSQEYQASKKPQEPRADPETENEEEVNRVSG